MQRIRDACHVISKEHAASGNQEDIAMDNKLKELLKKDYVILDGGMGTMLQAAGMKMGETPEMLNITQPELLISIHESILMLVQISYMPIHLEETDISLRNVGIQFMNLLLLVLRMQEQHVIMSSQRHL